MTPEAQASQRVRLAASRLGLRLMRNNSGMAYNESGQPIRFGLGNESAKLNKQIKFGDYVGWTPVTITPEMVGKTVAVFTNIECKPEGKLQTTLNRAHRHPESREGAQLAAINLVRNNGGIAWFATCEADVEQIISAFLYELKSR